MADPNASAAMTDDTIPAGFVRHDRRSGLTDPWEPIYALTDDKAVRLALRAGPAHANSRGFVHGGLISALADNAMGLSCGRQLTGASGLVTVTLTVDFISTGRIGQWIEFRPEVIKVGRALCFASALVMADDAICARANATFSARSSPQAA